MKRTLSLILSVFALGVFAADNADTSQTVAAIRQQIAGIRSGISAAQDSVASAASTADDSTGADLSAVYQALVDILGKLDKLDDLKIIDTDILSVIDSLNVVSVDLSSCVSILGTISEQVSHLNENLDVVLPEIKQGVETINVWLDSINNYLANMISYVSIMDENVGRILDRIDTGLTVSVDKGGELSDRLDQLAQQVKDNRDDIYAQLLHIGGYMADLNVTVTGLSDSSSSSSGGINKAGSILEEWFSNWTTEFVTPWRKYSEDNGLPTLLKFYEKWFAISDGKNGFIPKVTLDSGLALSGSVDKVELQYLDYAKYKTDLREGETNVAELVDFKLGENADFFGSCIKILAANLKVAAANGKTSYEILSCLRSSESPIAEEDMPSYTDSITDMNNEYDDGEGWKSRFGGITNEISKIKSDVRGSSSIGTVFGQLSGEAPSSISLTFPAYNWEFEGFSMSTETTVVSMEIDGSAALFFENCRAVAVFLWYTLAVLIHFFMLRLFIRLFRVNVIGRFDNMMGGTA